MTKQFFGDHITRHQYQLSYEMAVDSSPLSPSNYMPGAQEVIETKLMMPYTKQIISTLVQISDTKYCI